MGYVVFLTCGQGATEGEKDADKEFHFFGILEKALETRGPDKADELAVSAIRRARTCIIAVQQWRVRVLGKPPIDEPISEGKGCAAPSDDTDEASARSAPCLEVQ